MRRIGRRSESEGIYRKSSHEDMGYEDFIYKKQHEIANHIDIGNQTQRSTSAMGGGDYHYTLETLLFMRNYMDERSESQWRNMVEQHVSNGQMPLMGAPSGVHTHWMDYEELARMTYPARREAFDRFGLDLKTFEIVDNPSLSWSGAEVLGRRRVSLCCALGPGMEERRQQRL